MGEAGTNIEVKKTKASVDMATIAGLIGGFGLVTAAIVYGGSPITYGAEKEGSPKVAKAGAAGLCSNRLDVAQVPGVVLGFDDHPQFGMCRGKMHHLGMKGTRTGQVLLEHLGRQSEMAGLVLEIERKEKF